MDNSQQIKIYNGGSLLEVKPPTGIYDGKQFGFNYQLTKTVNILPPFQKAKGGTDSNLFFCPPSASMTALTVMKGGISLSKTIAVIER